MTPRRAGTTWVRAVFGVRCLFTFTAFFCPSISPALCVLLRFSPRAFASRHTSVVSEWLRLCPQYAYFRMGVSQADMVRTDFLQYSITKIRQRHTFLERLGRYQTPDKKGQTQVPNPSLMDMLRASEAEFLAQTACSSAEEFEVFKKLLAREEQEEPRNHQSGDKDEDEDEDEGSTSDEDPEREGQR